ncbi:2-oxo acid dehydrogenase subunit E2, partial [Enterococcus hirae]
AGRARVSPRARRRARELGVDLAGIERGSGAGGVIETRDVETAAAAQPSRQDRLRRVIAAAMSRSKREIPHYYLSHDIDLEPALVWLERVN